MAPLRNVKHENFCQLTIQGAKLGWTQGEIYQRAGYKVRGHGAEVLGSNLLKKIEVQRRIAELTAPAVRKTRVTVESLLAELEATVAAAREAKQFGAVNGSLTLIGKLTGLLREQVEIGGPGEFARCETAEQIMRRLAEEDLPGNLEHAKWMYESLLAIAAERAEPIS